MTSNIQISKRLDDGTILVIGGEDWAAFTANVSQAIKDEVDQDEVFEAFNALASIPGVGTQAVKNVQAGGLTEPGYVAPPPSRPQVAPAQPPAAAAPSCHHGTKVYREGNGQRGPWKAYFCPAPKGTPDQCKPDFIR